MTTGSIKTGPFPAGGTTKIHYAKAWTGGDGYTITTRYTSKPAWNAYLMATCKFRSSNPNKIGTRNLQGVYTERDNHSWGSGGGDALARHYHIPFGDGSISAAFPTSQFNLVFTAREELALLSKLLNKIKGFDLDLGVSLAEVDKLAGTVLGTLTNLRYGVADLARLRFGQFARRFGASPPREDRVRRLRTLDISGRFLEMRYAWEPTIKDVFAAAKAFEEISNGPRQLYFRTAKRRTLPTTCYTNYGIASQRVEARRSYLFEMYEEMGFARQLGLTNPATVLWERLPYSFVVDWFIPIGSYLSLLGQIPYMKGRWCRTSSIRWTTSGKITQSHTPSEFSVEQPFPDAEWSSFHLERSITATPPSVPFPNFRVQGAVQGKRVANAIALTHQVFAKLLGEKKGFVPLLF